MYDVVCMTLTEAKEKYLNKLCDINWEPIDRPPRKNETVSQDTKDVVVTEIYENCHGQILFRCKDKIYMPFEVNRLRNPRNIE